MIIDKARNEFRVKLQKQHPNFVYYETHHVIPKTLGGLDSKTNLVLLTPREHFVVHCLLPRMCANNSDRLKMNYAIRMMRRLDEIKHSKLYEFERIRINKEGMSKESKLKMSEMKRGKPGIPHTSETKLKIAKSRLGKTCSDETKRKIAESLRGRKHCDEHKQNVSESLIGKKRKPFSQEHKINLSLSHQGNNHSSETKLKISESMRKRNQNTFDQPGGMSSSPSSS